MIKIKLENKAALFLKTQINRELRNQTWVDFKKP